MCLKYRKAVPWRLITVALSYASDEDPKILEIEDAALVDKLVYVILALLGGVSLCSIIGFIGAAVHKRPAVQFVSTKHIKTIQCAINMSQNFLQKFIV